MDYNRTQIKSMALSSDSIKMNVQYFSFGKNEQNANSAITAIKAFVSSSTSFLGAGKSGEATTAIQQQLSQQVEHHEVLGTLVITANCTHKNALVLAPFFLDVDKAINVWNKMYPDKPLNPWDPSSMQKLAENKAGSEEEMNILSGAVYGSSFIGMVHIVKADDSTSS